MLLEICREIVKLKKSKKNRKCFKKDLFSNEISLLSGEDTV